MEAFIITVLIVILIFGGWIISVAISDKKNAPEIEKRNQQMRAERYARTQALLDQYNAALEEISQEINGIDVNIPIRFERSPLNGVWHNIPYAENSFYVSLTSKQIYYDGRRITFDKIINCDYIDDATTTSTQRGTASSTIKTNTGSTIGRAIVGGAIAGPAGAIIGGSSAKKNAETKILNKTTSTTKHDYTIRIHIADILNPLLEIKCGENEEATHKIVSTVFAIIEQNRQSQ